MKPKEILCLINWVCFVVSSVAGLAFEQVHNTSQGVVRRVATDQADPCMPSNHRNISHIDHRNINVRGSCPYTDGRLEDAWYYAGQNPISSYRHIPEMCSCGYKFPIWMNSTMPGVAEGVVSRTTCMRFGPFTCDQTINIQIKNCGNVTTASIISSASSPSSASSTITTSQTTATSTQDATTAISTSTGIPHTSVSGSMSSSQTTGRYTEKSTTTSRRSPTENATVTSVAQTTTQTTTTTSTGTSTATVRTSPYYIHFTTSVTRSTSQTATKSTEDATTTSRTSPYKTTNASGTSSTNQTATTSTKKYSEQKTTVAYVYNATRLTSFPWLLTTKSFWYEITTPGTKPQDAIFVNCNEFGWNITIDMNRLREIYPNAKSSDIYLGENNCMGVLSWNTVTFQQGLKECLTSQTVTENAIVYSNELVYAERDPNYAFIIRHYNWTVRVECDVRRNETSSGHIHHESNNLAHPTVTGNSHFSVNISFYKDPNFMNQLQGNRINVTVGDMVYVKVYTTTSDWTVKMRVHTCYAKPEQNSLDHMKYYIIQNGCAVDKNTHIISESTHETRFVFQDFEYTSNHEGIHVFCDAVFCGSQDMSRQCQQTCNPVVRRRNIDIEMIGKE